MDDRREVGPIEGREVASEEGSGPTENENRPGAATSEPTPGALARTWGELRHSRGNVPNSRPLPEWVRRFAWVLDDAVAVPGTDGRRVGVDGLISLVPIAGDAVGVGLSLVIVVVGVGAGVSIPTVLRMLTYIGIEAVIGLIPIGGTVFNMAFKANNRNVALIEADLADRRGTRRSSLGVLAITVMVLIAGFVMLVALSLAGVLVLVWLVSRIF